MGNCFRVVKEQQQNKREERIIITMKGSPRVRLRMRKKKKNFFLTNLNQQIRNNDPFKCLQWLYEIWWRKEEWKKQNSKKNNKVSKQTHNMNRKDIIASTIQRMNLICSGLLWRWWRAGAPNAFSGFNYIYCSSAHYVYKRPKSRACFLMQCSHSIEQQWNE